MCPVCTATVALIATDAPTTGGLTTLLVKKLRARARVARRLHSNARKPARGEQQHECAENLAQDEWLAARIARVRWRASSVWPRPATAR
jgi:hypothetical protein